MTVEVRRYVPDLASDWAHVLSHARNGIFQFDRRFLDYHGDRFVDISAIAYMDERPVAIIPAAFDPEEGKVSSHPGLTFGGPVFVRDLRGDDGIQVVSALLEAFRGWGGKSCLVKLLPEAFASYPSAEAAYAFWRNGFHLVRRDLSSLLPLKDALPFNELKRRSVKKARKHGLTVGETFTDEFHELLVGVLLAQHGAQPAHSKAELSLLQQRFPSEISVKGARLDGRLLAGTVVFNYGHIWHTQYLASSNEGRSLGALDLVVAELIEEAKLAGAQFISFGTSTEDNGQTLNQGLLWQKESYGARALVHDFMEGAL